MELYVDDIDNDQKYQDENLVTFSIVGFEGKDDNLKWIMASNFPENWTAGGFTKIYANNKNIIAVYKMII